jgi:hypothetical protein
MNQDLSEILIYYSTKSHQSLNSLLLNKSKDNLISCLIDLLTTYFNDKNSSSLREYLTVILSGYNHNPNKLGYNGYMHNSNLLGTPLNFEAKPKNIITTNYHNKKTKTKFNAEGSFNDYTEKRLEKDKSSNLNILSSGFLDGELLYIIEFSFNLISERLESQLKNIKGPYLRGASFSYNHIKIKNLIKINFINKEKIKDSIVFFNKNFYNFLINSD